MREAVAHNTLFQAQGFNYTPAESATATQGKKGQQHTFSFTEHDDQGDKSTFSLLCESHMRITDGDRVYFC